MTGCIGVVRMCVSGKWSQYREGLVGLTEQAVAAAMEKREKQTYKDGTTGQIRNSVDHCETVYEGRDLAAKAYAEMTGKRPGQKAVADWMRLEKAVYTAETGLRNPKTVVFVAWLRTKMAAKVP